MPLTTRDHVKTVPAVGYMGGWNAPVQAYHLAGIPLKRYFPERDARTFRSWVIEALADIRDRKTTFAPWPVQRYIYLTKLADIVALKAEDYFGHQWMYELTNAGKALLKSAEVPEGEW